MKFIEKCSARFDKRTKIGIGIAFLILVICIAFFISTLLPQPSSPGVIPIKDSEIFVGIPISAIGDKGVQHRDPKSLSVIIRYPGSWEAQISKDDMPGDVKKSYDIYTGRGSSEIFITGNPGILSVRVWKKEDNAQKMMVDICRGDPMYDNAKTAFLHSGSVIESKGSVDLAVSFHKDGSTTAF